MRFSRPIKNLAKISNMLRLHESYARLLMRIQNCLSWYPIEARAVGTKEGMVVITPPDFGRYFNQITTRGAVYTPHASRIFIPSYGPGYIRTL